MQIWFKTVLLILSVLLLASCNPQNSDTKIPDTGDTAASEETTPEDTAREETTSAETDPAETTGGDRVNLEPITQKAIRILTAADFEPGKDDAKSLRSAKRISVTKNTVVTYSAGDMEICFSLVNESGTVQQVSDTLSGEGAFEISADGYLTITLTDKEGADMSASDYTAEISIRFSPRIYRFGGEGNDWCFVYLPPDYDPDRDEPYPFVICNHGNGWTMDGTIRYANWTKRTMYVPLDDPDYIRDPANYNGTDDEALWYSNPTIEAFLGAGYIVAGCENYGDNLYGNDNCRSACADFFWHMTETYNVKDSCYMIGASNGAMTTLNASYLLGERVKAVILQYPLCCLTNQYFGHTDHQGPIRKAYEITDAPLTEGEFLAKIGAEFDPLYTNVEAGVKQGYFPAVKIYFSTTDVTTKATLNAMPLCKLLQNSGKEVEFVRVDQGGQTRHHGDYAHFDPAGYLKFFEAHK